MPNFTTSFISVHRETVAETIFKWLTERMPAFGARVAWRGAGEGTNAAGDSPVHLRHLHFAVSGGSIAFWNAKSVPLTFYYGAPNHGNTGPHPDTGKRQMANDRTRTFEHSQFSDRDKNPHRLNPPRDVIEIASGNIRSEIAMASGITTSWVWKYMEKVQFLDLQWSKIKGLLRCVWLRPSGCRMQACGEANFDRQNKN